MLLSCPFLSVITCPTYSLKKYDNMNKRQRENELYNLFEKPAVVI